MKRVLRGLGLAALMAASSALVTGCGGPAKEEAPKKAPKVAEAPPAPPEPPTPQPAGTDAAAEAEQVYSTVCASCHGPGGQGDGAAAAALDPKPADFTDPAWHKEKQDDELAKAIVEGGAAVGKSPLMPANPTLRDKPEVVKALIAKIRAFGGGEPEAGAVPAPTGETPSSESPSPTPAPM